MPQPMIAKFIAPLFALAVSFGSANALTINVNVVANSATGLVTNGPGPSLVSGTAYLYSTRVDLTPSVVEAAIFSGSWDEIRANFEELLFGDPGLVRGPVSFTSGGLVSFGATEMGAEGNNTYLLLIGGSTNPNLVGIYQGPDVPSVGGLTLTPSTMSNDLFGTSTLQTVGGVNSGFQLAVVPEPSITLLGALGFLGLVRRRR